MTTPPPLIPQANPGAGYRALKSEIDTAVARALESGWYILGAEGRAFEAEFAAWLGTTATVGCANGTDALALAMRSLDIGAGSSVVTVSHTAVATVAAIEMTGATPLLLDIDPASYTLDPRELAAVLQHPPPGLPPIRAVIAVHLYGQAADLDAIAATCRQHGVALIEDCAQAHGATWRGRKLGTIGDLGTFSFYPTKNLGALGDGGAVATRDADQATRLAALRQYGWRSHYISDEVGVNSRLDEVQAAILRVKLAHLDAHNARRQAIAAAYDAALSGSSLRAPPRRADADHVFHLYVVRTPHRDAVQARLRAAGVATGIHYPSPVHLQPAYRNRVALGPAGCRQTEVASREVLSLPLYPELTDAQVEQVCAALRASVALPHCG
jgi:dTDP-4-amino-4,6-dideoxygalactose transaminase